MELQNKTKLTVELQLRFSKKLFWKSAKKTLIIIELILLAIIGLVLGIYIEKWWIAVVAGVFGILLPILLSIMMQNTASRTLKDAAKSENETDPLLEYRFFENGFEVKLFMNQGQLGYQKFPYDQFMQILESPDLFVFMVDTNQAFYVEKSGFFDGNASQLSDIVSLLPSYKKI